MAELESQEVASTLEGVREAVAHALDALTAPYERLASTDGEAVLGSPVRMPTFGRSAKLRALADRIEEGGRNAWALHQVETRENQLGAVLEDYQHGRYSTTPVGDWITMVSRFRDGVLADIHTAMQAPRGWDRLHLGASSRPTGAADGAVLTPKHVAKELGLAERTVRRRILKGELGPWRKRGSRWVISREAFHRHWERLLEDDDVPRPTGEGGAARRANDDLDHLKL